MLGIKKSYSRPPNLDHFQILNKARLRMQGKFKMNFSVPNWSQVELGSIGETVWSLIPSFDTSGRGCVDIIRSRGNGKVYIDVRVCNQEAEILLECRHPLTDGQKSTQLTFTASFFYPNKPFKGHVVIYYNSHCPLASKNEAVTQTENGFSSPQLANDLLHLLDNTDSFSDATLVCGSAKIPVHRNILSTRSPVFAAMFKTQMQEGHDGVVDIVDMEPDALQVMLKYVYSGKTDHLTHSLAEDLLFGADKYQLEELKLICVEQLRTSMAASNVFRSLVLGDLHDKSLKMYAVEFICKCKKFSDLEKSEEWQSLLKEHSHLAVEVLTTVVKSLQKE